MLFLVLFFLVFPLLIFYLFFHSLSDSLYYIDGIFESLYWWQLYTKAVRWTDANYVQFYYRAMYLTESIKKAFRHYFFDQNRFTHLYHRFYQMRRHRDYVRLRLFQMRYLTRGKKRKAIRHTPRTFADLSFFWSEDVWSYVIAVKRKFFMPISFTDGERITYSRRSKKIRRRRYYGGFSPRTFSATSRSGRVRTSFVFTNLLMRLFGDLRFNHLKLRFLRRNFRYRNKSKIFKMFPKLFYKRQPKRTQGWLYYFFRRYRSFRFIYRNDKSTYNAKPYYAVGLGKIMYNQRRRVVSRIIFMNRIKEDILAKTKYFKIKFFLKPKKTRKYFRVSSIAHWSYVRPLDFLRNRIVFRRLNYLRTTFNFNPLYENHLRAPMARRYKRFKTPFYTNHRKNFFFRNFGKTFHAFYYDNWPQENQKVIFKYHKNAYVNKLERLYNRYVSRRFEVSRRPLFYRYSINYPMYMNSVINSYFRSHRRGKKISGFRHKGRIFP